MIRQTQLGTSSGGSIADLGTAARHIRILERLRAFEITWLSAGYHTTTNQDITYDTQDDLTNTTSLG